MPRRHAPPDPIDPIDLAAAAVAAKLTLTLAGEIARALRKLAIRAPLPERRDPTAAERQRRRRRAVAAKGREPGAAVQDRAANNGGRP